MVAGDRLGRPFPRPTSASGTPRSPTVDCALGLHQRPEPILVVSAIVVFVGAILAFLLVRQKDFVASGPEAAAGGG